MLQSRCGRSSVPPTCWLQRPEDDAERGKSGAKRTAAHQANINLRLLLSFLLSMDTASHALGPSQFDSLHSAVSRRSRQDLEQAAHLVCPDRPVLAGAAAIKELVACWQAVGLFALS